jgi:hypothetical protein
LRISEHRIFARGGIVQGQRIGYVRVSSFDQNPDRQLEGVLVDKMFTDQASGKDTRRPELDALLGFVRKGDTVLVHSMDRLARNLDDLRRLVQTLTKRGVRVEFVKEQLIFTGEDSPVANLMLSVMGACASANGRCCASGSARASRWPSCVGSTGAARSRSRPRRWPNCGSGPRPASRRQPWPARSGSAAKPSTNT